MSNKLPKISTVIFSFNFEKFIRECIESILTQTLQPYEIIISDDHSSDNSWEIISEYSDRYPKIIKAYRHKKNIGMGRNINFALRQAKGDLITWLDGDDRWLPRKIEMEWKALQENPQAKIAYSNVYIITADGTRTGTWYDGKGATPPVGDVFVPVFSKRFFPNIRSVFRQEMAYRSVHEELGFVDENIKIYIDWDFKIRATAQFHVAYSGEALVEYRIHDQGISRSSPSAHFDSLCQVIKKNLPLLSSRNKSDVLQIKPNIESLLKLYEPSDKYLEEFSKIQLQFDQIIKEKNTKIKINKVAGENLIFIISQPRAGSTLLQRILAGHPDIHTTAEPWIMLHPLYSLKRDGHTSEYDINLAKDALDDFLVSIDQGEDTYIKGISKMASFLYNKALKKSGKTYFLDKTPRYYFIIPELYRTFPKAKFIFLLRNPLAVLSSILNTWVKENWDIISNFKHDLLRAPQLIADGINLLKRKALIVHYEELSTNPEHTIKSLCDIMKIKFYQEMLEYGLNPIPKGRMGDQTNIYKHKKPTSIYLNKWVEQLTSPYIRYLSEIYLSILGPELLTSLGYSYDELSSIIQSVEYKKELLDKQIIEKIIANLGIPYSELPKLKIKSLSITKEFLKKNEAESVRCSNKAEKAEVNSEANEFKILKNKSQVNTSETSQIWQSEYQLENVWPEEVISLVNQAEELIKKANLIDLIRACDAINDALDIMPDDPILLVTLGKIFLLMGKKDAAYHEIERAIQRAPDFVLLLLKQLNIQY
jgi:glycosyltransferase involved in cell wall biosynthesis